MSYGSTHVKGSRMKLKPYGCKAKTEQSHKQECDINYIMTRYRKTGQLPVREHEPVYADVSNLKTFQQAQDLVAQGLSKFNALPAAVRAKYKNDPKQWLDSVDRQLKEANEKRVQEEKDKIKDKELATLKEEIKKKGEKGA